MQAAQVKRAKSYIPRYINEGEDFWKQHMMMFSKSGLTKTAYCKANQVNYARFFYWIKKLSAHPKQITNSQNQDSIKTNHLLSVQLKHDSKLHDGILCTLLLKNGCTLRIHDQQSLSQILAMWG